MNCRQNVFLENPVFGMRSSRKPRERHKDKEQDAYTFYSTEALITRIARQALAGPFRPRQAITSRLRRTTNAIKRILAGKAKDIQWTSGMVTLTWAGASVLTSKI